MNPTLFKLRVSQAKCPVKKGQVLPVCKDLNQLKTDQNNTLNYGSSDFYQVNSVNKGTALTGGEKKETYKMALTPVIWDEAEMNWGPKKEGSVSPHPFDISISSQELYEHFAITSKETTAHTALKGEVSQMLEDALRKNKLYNKWLDVYQNVDIDKMFKGIAINVFSKSPIRITEEDREDLFHTALVETLTPEVISKFDFNRNENLAGYLAYNFQRFLISRVQRFQNKKYKEDVPPKDSEFSEEDRLEYLNEQTSRSKEHAPIHDVVEYNILMEDIHDFLEAQKNGELYNKILNSLLEGYSKKEIASQVGLTVTSFSNYLNRMYALLEEYATESENDLLMALLKQYRGKKAAQKEDKDGLYHVFNDYAKQTGVKEESMKLAERVPVGETITIQRKPLPDLENLTKQVVQDPEKSSAQATKDVETYFQDLLNSDELIEDGGKLIALKVQRKV
ncbi:MAG: hypothetical protein WC511_01820 [Candidatus Pacearchaeota archaeon]